MRSLVCCFALSLLAMSGARADATLAHARRAQALLGDELWSTVVEIENDTRRGRYPARLHALVFEVAGLLWFYTSRDGTQSFSLHRGQVEREKSDFGPLLRAIEPGFTRWRMVESLSRGAESQKPPSRAALPNGCFVESIAAWRAQSAAGEKMSAPQLLSYYLDTPTGPVGHTVLTYATDRGVTVIDPARRRPQTFPAELRGDASKLAQALLRAPVARARWVPLDNPRRSRAAVRLAERSEEESGGGGGMDDAAAWPRVLSVR